MDVGELQELLFIVIRGTDIARAQGPGAHRLAAVDGQRTGR
jgi:hypothetical protein